MHGDKFTHVQITESKQNSRVRHFYGYSIPMKIFPKLQYVNLLNILKMLSYGRHSHLGSILLGSVAINDQTCCGNLYNIMNTKLHTAVFAAPFIVRCV